MNTTSAQPFVDNLEEELSTLDNVRRAMLNILEDISTEKQQLGEVQHATVNILDDLDGEKIRLEDVQRATLNLLEDFDSEKSGLRQMQRATVNILEDLAGERMHMENSHRALLNILEDVDAERATVTALNQQLEAANKELEAFSYTASHDLQEPLRMVSSYTQLLARRYKGKLDADADEFIAYAVDGATRMQRLINDLLAYSRVGTRGRPFEPVDCHAMLGLALANLRAAIEQSNALVMADALPTVMADELQLAQLFQNLIGNAIKFCRQERPYVQISVRQQGQEWVFSVRDNGIGIAPEYHDRIFGIFERLHGSKEYPGTGIGLALCKKIVERHAGRIWVDSEEGSGSTFSFTLPMKRGE